MVWVASPGNLRSPDRALRPSSPADGPTYLGVYEAGALHAYQPIADFTKAADRQPNLVGFYSGWGNPSRHRSWKPSAATARPRSCSGIRLSFRSRRSPLVVKTSTWARLRTAFREFGRRVVIGFGHKINAYWYSWGYGHLPAWTFVAAWQHIVTLFRAQRANNVTWLWQLQADETGTSPVASRCLGVKYVTWVGIDGYYYGPFENFFGIFGKTIGQVRTITGLPDHPTPGTLTSAKSPLRPRKERPWGLSRPASRANVIPRP